jgi:murein DD-endopeptidase MepM/ murein hydrolase activator NlpD
MTEKIAIYVEPFPKAKRGDGFKNMASYRTNPHRGVDWSVAGGSKIKAITGGTVLEVGHTAVLGNYLIQSTYDGCFLLYAHFQIPTTLKQGDKVEAGKTIVGLVGTTGTASTGNHLHVTYGVKKNLITAGMPDLRDLFAVLDAAPKKTVAAKVVSAVKKVVPTKAAKSTVVLSEPAKPKAE